MNPVYFWIVSGLFFVSWLIYPVILFIAGALRKRSFWIEPRTWPSVSVLISARNEEKVIGDRIDNLLNQDYPGDLEILIGSDASEDATDGIVRSYHDRGVVLYRSRERIGKPGIVQMLFGISGGEIIVLTDADTLFAEDALKQLVLPFSDPEVGCVDGSRCNSLCDETCESTYWRYEKIVKKLCSVLGSVLGATGAIFALRRQAFKPLSTRRSDDFELAVMARILGYSCVFSENAIAAEPSPDDAQQYRRLVRIASWMIVSCRMLMGKALRKGKLLLFLQLLVHKMLRWLSGLFLIAATVLAAVLSGSALFLVIFLAMCLFHAIAAFGWLLRGGLPSWFLFPYYFWLMNFASIDGIFRAIFGNPVEVWEQKQEGT